MAVFCTYRITDFPDAQTFIGFSGIPTEEDLCDEKGMGNGRRTVFAGQTGHSFSGRTDLGGQSGCFRLLRSKSDAGLAQQCAGKRSSGMHHGGCISHANNGILGEVFNAVMTSLSFVEKDIRTLIETAISLIPSDSEYRSVLDFVWERCRLNDDWRRVLADCEERYRKYNWIHAYPNACCEVIALYFGEGDFSETLHIITMCGLDADCNAGMIMPVAAIRDGCGSIPEKYAHPAFDKLTTYMRGGMREITLDALVEKTVRAVCDSQGSALCTVTF